MSSTAKYLEFPPSSRGCLVCVTAFIVFEFNWKIKVLFTVNFDLYWLSSWPMVGWRQSKSFIYSVVSVCAKVFCTSASKSWLLIENPLMFIASLISNVFLHICLLHWTLLTLLQFFLVQWFCLLGGRANLLIYDDNFCNVYENSGCFQFCRYLRVVSPSVVVKLRPAIDTLKTQCWKLLPSGRLTQLFLLSQITFPEIVNLEHFYWCPWSIVVSLQLSDGNASNRQKFEYLAKICYAEAPSTYQGCFFSKFSNKKNSFFLIWNSTKFSFVCFNKSVLYRDCRSISIYQAKKWRIFAYPNPRRSEESLLIRRIGSTTYWWLGTSSLIVW